MSETRKPEFIFQIYRKNSHEDAKRQMPTHLSSFELYPARLWKGKPNVSKFYGPLTPLAGLFRLRVDNKWYEFHPDYIFLTFREVWRVIGSMASESMAIPVDWNNDTHHLSRGDRVRIMGKEGFSQTIVLKSQLDEIGVEWVELQGKKDPVPANALSRVHNADKSNATSFNEALSDLKQGMTLWYWRSLNPDDPDYPELWEVITTDLAAQRGLDPKLSTIVALQLGGMGTREAEEFYANNIA